MPVGSLKGHYFYRAGATAQWGLFITMIPRAPLPLATLFYNFLPQPARIGARSRRVAGNLEVSGLRGALDDTPICVRLHRQLPVGRVPGILGDDRHTAWINLGAHLLVAAKVHEQ